MFKFLDNLSIRNKIWFMIVLFVSAIIVGSVIDVLNIRSTLWTEKELKTRHLVETAYGVLSRYQGLQQAGTLSEEAAKAEAISTIKALRYEGKEYFWLNDLGKPFPKMIMHPTVPALDGKVLDAERFNCATSQSFGDDVKAIKTDGKKNLFSAFAEVAEQSGKGYVTYNWPKPKAGGGTTDQLFPKLSYVKKFEPWGWVIGSGIYVDDVDDTIIGKIWHNLALLAVVAAALLVLAGILTRSITRPLREVADAMRDISQGDGDLTRRLSEHGAYEIVRVAAGFNGFGEKIQHAILRVVAATHLLNKDSLRLSGVARETAANISRQDKETASVSVAIEGMLSNVQRVAGRADSAVTAAHQADTEATLGMKVVNETIESIRSVASEVGNATNVIAELEDDSRNIGDILDTIKAIANQTNLLALNAAIEAARAGEQGRGFAVVADEVRKLAQSTQEATAHIQELIEHLQNKTQAAVKVMREGRERVDASVIQAGHAGESLEKITRSVSSIRDMNTEIARSAEDQLNVARGISSSITAINRMSVETSSGVSSTEDAVSDLIKLLDELKTLVSQFKVS
jgi:methyl-accepting chemotaxis protein